MADANTSMPIKTESDVDEKVQVKIVDYTTPTQGQEVDTDCDAHVKAKLRDDTGAAFGTEANPVRVAETEDPGDEVEDYQTSAAVAKTHRRTMTILLRRARLLKLSSLLLLLLANLKLS